MICNNCGTKNGLDPTARCHCGEDEPLQDFCDHRISMLHSCEDCAAEGYDHEAAERMAERYPYTVVEVKSPTLVMVQGDGDRRDTVVTISLRKDGYWRKVGDKLHCGYRFKLGVREFHMCREF
jgi:hypothetical protein